MDDGMNIFLSECQQRKKSEAAVAIIIVTVEY